jgi:hypothetical protein
MQACGMSLCSLLLWRVVARGATFWRLAGNTRNWARFATSAHTAQQARKDLSGELGSSGIFLVTVIHALEMATSM